MIGQFSLNFLQIVVDIKSGAKFMMGVASEFVKPTNLKYENHWKNNLKYLLSLYFFFSNQFILLRTILSEGIFVVNRYAILGFTKSFCLNWWIF